MRTKEYLELSIEELLNIYNGNDPEMIRTTYRARLLNVAISKAEKDTSKSDLLPFLRVEQYVNQFILRKYPDFRFQTQTLYKQDGTPFENPDINQFTDDNIQQLKEKAETTESTVLKSFYCDFLWFKERKIDYAISAIQAYHELVDFQYDNEYKFETTDSIDRILAISAEIRSEDELSKAYQKAIELCEQIKGDDTGYLVKSILFSILKHHKRLKDVIDYSEIIEIADLTTKNLKKENQGQFSAERSLLDVQEEVYRLTKKQEERDKIKLRIVESFVSEGDWVKKVRNSNWIAAKFYEDGMKLLINMGGHNKRVEELKVMIQEANKIGVEQEMGTVSHQWTVEQDKIDEYMIIYKNRTIEEVVSLLIRDPFLIPSYNKISEDVDKSSFDINDLFTTTYFDGHRQIATALTNEEKREHKIKFEFNFNIQYAEHIILRQIFDIIKQEHPNYKADIIKMLRHSDFILEDRILFIEKGIEYYEIEDYFGAVHSMMFIVEGVLRDMVVQLGGVDFSYRDGRMKLRTLTSLLSDLQKNPNEEEWDFFKFIEFYLTEYGFNYRNKIAHADIKINAFNRAVAEYLMLMFLRISTYRKIKHK